MDNTKILSAYQQLLLTCKQQIIIAEKQRYDEQIEEIEKLEKEKNNLIILINQERITLNDYQGLSTANKATVKQCIEEIQQINQKLQSILEAWYSENSLSMKQVTSQRKTLQTYGGINYSDVISYYFDEKK